MRKLMMISLALAVLACSLLLTTADGREAGASAMRRRPRALLPMVMRQPTPTDTETPTPTPTETETLTPTPTPTEKPPEACTVQVVSWFDTWRDGARGPGEPALSRVGIHFVAADRDASCATDDTGSCTVRLPSGTYRVDVIPPESRFRHITPRGRTIALHARLPEFEGLGVEGDTVLLVPLTEGYLVWPSTSDPGDVGTFQDRILGAGCRNWCDDSARCGDGHVEGMDLCHPQGTMNVASAAMFVEEVRETSMGITVVFGVPIENDEADVEVDLDYSHLQTLELTARQLGGHQIVEVGDALGESGPWGSYPHLHFAHYRFRRSPGGRPIPLEGQEIIAVDPYAALWLVGELSYWTVKNTPQVRP